jgi:aryl-alcohol dehydrogenase-like predicted oxidoreductase
MQIALGTMNFGKRTPAPEAERITLRALERGVTVFDTANVYNDGESERILGLSLGKKRASCTVASKVGLLRVRGKVEGLSRSAIATAIDATLARLGTDHLDHYYLHAPDHAVPIDESHDAMAALVASGKVRAWGVSNYAAWQILEMNALAAARAMPPPAISQVLYNVLIRDLEIEYLPFTRKHPIHTTVYNPLAGGLLTGAHAKGADVAKGSRFDGNAMYRRRYWSDAMFARVAELEVIAKDEHLELLELAYAWVAGRPGVDSILVGPATVAHLDAALDACEKKLSASALERIDALHRAWRGTDASYAR